MKWNSVLDYLYNHDTSIPTTQEVSDKTHVPPATVNRYVRKFKDLTEKNSLAYKYQKSQHLISKLYSSGLIDFLVKKLNPSVVVVFGSVRKGEYDESSDIDLFVETSSKKSVDLKQFEKEIGHDIDLFVKKNINDLQPRLQNNVINGIKLYGYLKIR